MRVGVPVLCLKSGRDPRGVFAGGHCTDGDSLGLSGALSSPQLRSQDLSWSLTEAWTPLLRSLFTHRHGRVLLSDHLPSGTQSP